MWFFWSILPHTFPKRPLVFMPLRRSSTAGISRNALYDTLRACLLSLENKFTCGSSFEVV